MHRTAWIVFDDHGGDLDVADLPVPDVVVAADSGLRIAQQLGLHVDLVVGDLDSVLPGALAAARASGVEVQQHPAGKDATDLGLALAAAFDRTDDGDDLVVVGGSGGRLDHALANVAALTDHALVGRQVRARLGGADVHVVRGEAAFHWPVGALVTLLPVGGPARGVTTSGLQYPLDGEDLPAGSTRGVSNVVEAPQQRVEVLHGCVVAVLPPETGA